MTFRFNFKYYLLPFILFFSFANLAEQRVEIEDKNNPQAYIDYAKSIQRTNPRVAHKVLDEASTLAKAQNKPELVGRALLEHAQTAKLNKNYLSAQQYLIRAEAMSNTLEDDELLVDIYTNMSSIQRYQENYDKSMDYVQKGLVLARESHEPHLIFKALQIKGALLEKMKRYEDSLEAYLLAQRYMSGVTHEQRVRLLRDTADAYNRLNEYDSAISYYGKAIKEIEGNNDIKELPRTLVELSKTHSKNGNFSKAIENGKRALSIAREYQQQTHILKSLVVLSIIYRKISSYEDSISNGLEALAIYQNNKDYDGIAASSNALGLTYSHLNQNDSAKAYFINVLELPTKEINAKYRAAALRDLGKLYFSDNQQQKAIKLSRESHHIYEKIGSRNGVATVQKNLGYFNFMLGNVQDAHNSYDASISLFHKLHDVWNEADSMAQLAIVLIEKDISKSITLANKSLTLAKEIGAKSVSETAYQALVLVEEKRGNYKKALFYARQKESIINEIKTDAINKRSAEMYIILDVEKKEKAFEILKRQKEVISLELDNKQAKLTLLEKEKRITELQKQNTLIIASVSIVAVMFALLIIGRVYFNMNYRFIVIVIIVLLALLYSVNSNSKDIIKITNGQSSLDIRPKYTRAILTEALKQSEAKYGAYEIQIVKEMMSNDVKRWEVYDGKNINLTMAMTSPDWEYLTIPIRIPIRRGVGSYRLLAINKHNQYKFSKKTTYEELKLLKVGLQKQWIMNDLFEEEGFDIIESSSYDATFRMLNKQRFDFIPRGIHEIYDELSLRENELTNLMVEPNLVLYLPQPFYIFVSPKHPEIAERIEFGLEKMVKEGLLQAMFEQHYSASIKKANLSNRKVINLGNKYLTKKTPIERKELWLKFDFIENKPR